MYAAGQNLISNNENIIIATSGLGMFLATLDSGIMNVALPTLNTTFHTSIHVTAWTITLYLLVLSSTILWFGKLSDKFGRTRILAWGLITFGISSFLCGLSTSAGALIIFRGIQGCGAAMLQATAAALIMTLLPPERKGAALGTLGMIMGIGPILGPIIGGSLISFLDWRWIFWINIPLCLLGLWCCNQIKELETRNNSGMNSKASILIAISMTAVILLISLHNQLTLTIDLLLAAVAVIAFAAFCRHEQRAAYPLLDLTLFKQPAFRASLLGTLAFGIAIAIVLIVPPLYLEKSAGLLPWQVGLITFCTPIGVVITARFSGKRINQIGTAKLMIIGLVIMLTGLLSLTVSHNKLALPIFALLLLVIGAGGGIFQPPNVAAVMGAAPVEEQGVLGAVNRMVHNFGNALGVGFASLLLTRNTTDNIQVCWLLAFIILAITLIGFINLYRQSMEKNCE